MSRSTTIANSMVAAVLACSVLHAADPSLDASPRQFSMPLEFSDAPDRSRVRQTAQSIELVAREQRSSERIKNHSVPIVPAGVYQSEQPMPARGEFAPVVPAGVYGWEQPIPATINDNGRAVVPAGIFCDEPGPLEPVPGSTGFVHASPVAFVPQYAGPAPGGCAAGDPYCNVSPQMVVPGGGYHTGPLLWDRLSIHMEQCWRRWKIKHTQQHRAIHNESFYFSDPPYRTAGFGYYATQWRRSDESCDVSLPDYSPPALNDEQRPTFAPPQPIPANQPNELIPQRSSGREPGIPAPIESSHRDVSAAEPRFLAPAIVPNAPIVLPGPTQ